ncbi:hypothetical protein DICPUDRAFT_153527 [Dictyostelium purpureum]|uniref:Uncharacterized protein n=1 Tax=Dictyostelium purpureum TaxID=5786 RepID=F0ZP51_DICPU|nr:uncharacterized protein DICPUDRAFT_153527 [Dictyostelium purpureum]EGC34272.1 hypothetical protein DICPUDRAFT_153527 [Dictyostelium purpureum]|eukprot:XP_003289201.1 hypothetical protein DICPUDRAFT_153527 [Dictyostelium purpureum]
MNDVKSFPSIPDENLYSLLSLSNPKSVNNNNIPLSNSSSPLNTSNNENTNGIGSLLSSKKDTTIQSDRNTDDRHLINYYNPLKTVMLNNQNNNNNNNNNNHPNNNLMMQQNRGPYSLFPLYHNDNIPLSLSNSSNLPSNTNNHNQINSNNMNLQSNQSNGNILQNSLDLINNSQELGDIGDYNLSNLLYDENYTNITSLICCKCNNKQSVENKVFLSNNINVIPGPEDKNYEFRCFNCSKGQFYFRHLFKTWKEMIHTSLFNLEREKKYRFSHYREIIKYVHKHSKELLADREKVLNTKMKNIMTATLSYNRKIFISFARDSGMWSNYRSGDNIEEDDRGLLTWKGNDQWEGYIDKDSTHTLTCKACSKPSKFEMRELQGSNVLPGPLDSRFEFCCENCTIGKKPTLKHLSKSWKEVAHTALFNLEIIKKYRFSHQIEIASYVKSHQDSFAFNREMDNIKNRLSTVLSRYKKAFTSIGRYTGMWSNWRDGDENLQELQDIEDDDEEESNEFDGVDPDDFEKNKSSMNGKNSKLTSKKNKKNKNKNKSTSSSSTSSTPSSTKTIKSCSTSNSGVPKSTSTNSTPTKLKINNLSSSTTSTSSHQNSSSASNCSSLVGSPVPNEFFNSPKKTPLIPNLVNSIENNNFSISENISNNMNINNNSSNSNIPSHNANMLIHNQLPQNLIQQNYLHYNNNSNSNNTQNISPKLSPDSSTTTPILSNSPNFNFYSNVYYSNATPNNQLNHNIFNGSSIVHKNNTECCICQKNKQLLQKCKNHICSKSICKECISNNVSGIMTKQLGNNNEIFCLDCNNSVTDNSNSFNSNQQVYGNNYNSNFNYMYYNNSNNNNNSNSNNNNSNNNNSNNTNSNNTSTHNSYMNEINYSVNSLGEHSYIGDLIKSGFKPQPPFIPSIHQQYSQQNQQQSILLNTLHQQIHNPFHQINPTTHQNQQIQQQSNNIPNNGSNSPNSKQKRKIANEKTENNNNKVEKRSKGFTDQTTTFDSQQLQQTPPLNMLSMSIHSSPQHPTTPLHHSQPHQSIHSSPLHHHTNNSHHSSHHGDFYHLSHSSPSHHHNSNPLSSPTHHSNNHLSSPPPSQYYFEGIPHPSHQRNLFSAPQFCSNNQQPQQPSHSHLPFQIPTPNFPSSLITLPTLSSINNDYSNDHHSHHSNSGNTTNSSTNSSNNNNVNSLVQSSGNLPPPPPPSINSLTNPLIKSI